MQLTGMCICAWTEYLELEPALLTTAITLTQDKPSIFFFIVF